MHQGANSRKDLPGLLARIRRVYLFDLRTEWFDEFSEIQDEIHLLAPDPDAGDDDSPIGGYFSRN